LFISWSVVSSVLRSITVFVRHFTGAVGLCGVEGINDLPVDVLYLFEGFSVVASFNRELLDTLVDAVLEFGDSVGGFFVVPGRGEFGGLIGSFSFW
jgi:hypothetical protein